MNHHRVVQSDSPAARGPRLARRAALCAGLLLLTLVPGVAWAAHPTVNGLFYGDGDNTLYQPYATSYNGSILYSYYDAPTTTLYVALVVSQGVNDEVCAPSSDNAYTGSATPPWSVGGAGRDCKRGSDSEFAAFTFECAPGSANSWTWQQALGCAQTAGPPPSNWASSLACGPSMGPWPPGLVATSSWVANVNTYQNATTTRGWPLYTFSTDLKQGWKSPWVAAAPDNVTAVPGYPTYSGSNFQWEWSMVYEWSLNIGPSGVNCGGQSIYFITGASHHSPPKALSSQCTTNNDCFPPPPADPTFSDWGDLPNSYSTLSANSGARHYIKVSGPYLGQVIEAEQDGVPTADATGDGTEEDGVTANVTGTWTAGSTQSVTVVVSNAPSGALLGGWFDWNHDGDVADAGEFFSWPVVQGTNVLTFTVGAGFNWQTDQLYARFRLFSSGAAAPGGSLNQADFAGIATDGEVEDYVFTPGSLPVTLNALTSDTAGGELTVRWQTASETDNVGFEVWGLVGGKWQALGRMIASQGMNSALPQTYELHFDAPQGLTAVSVADYGTRGRTENFGPFAVGSSHGEFQPIQRLDWRALRAERASRLLDRGFAKTKAGAAPGEERAEGERWRKLLSGAPLRGAAASLFGASTVAVDGGGENAHTVSVTAGASTDVAVTQTGIQRVTYEALRAGGRDLAGVHAKDIAVTWRGEAVARWIDGGNNFGPGSAVEFVGRAPTGDDALYIDASLYQIGVDPLRAREAGKLGRGKAQSVSPLYVKETWVDRPLSYNSQSPTGDPWVEQTILTVGGTPRTVTLDLPITGPVATAASRLRIGLGAITDLPDVRQGGQVLPEHNVEVWFRGPGGTFAQIGTASRSGNGNWMVEADLPLGALQTGVNQVQLRFSTQYPYSLVVLDRYGVSYRSPYLGPTLNFGLDRSARGYHIDGFATSAIDAYAEGADGSLTRLDVDVIRSGAGYAAEVRDADAARFWVTESPFAPAVFSTAAPGDLLAGSGDLVVIADSSFIGTPALDDYLWQKSAFNPIVVDVEDVYNAFGFGMALPSAITNFLRARNAVAPFTHVQLVGADCYDRRNYISSCVSFLPLPTAPVGVSVYSPSQNRLVDLDGDGVGDKAVGQFSVRTAAELATIVAKGADWDASGLSASSSALFVAEESDGQNDFLGQASRLSQRLGWGQQETLDMAQYPNILDARSALQASLGDGRALTVFSGHASSSVWAFRSLLTSAVVSSLTNAGRPTLMVPLACETSYDISPNANVLGHQLLFDGDRGAVAISGAVALSSLADNERMADSVIDGLKAGLTLGQAVLAGRHSLGPSDQTLQDNWITQGDVTLRLQH